MQKTCILLIGLFTIYASRASAAIDEATWRNIFDTPMAKKTLERWCSPREELEKSVREQKVKTGELPNDPDRAEKYVKDYVAFNVTYYGRIYKGTKIDVEAAKRVLTNDDFDDAQKADALLLLYIDSGDIAYLKKYFFAHPQSPRLFLRVRDPAVVNLVLEIVAEGYKERLGDLDGPLGKNATVVADSLPELAGIMYVQNGGNISVARRLFRDYWTFAGVSQHNMVPPVEAAQILYEQGSKQALEDFLYALYQNCEGHMLVTIKSSVTPELAEIVDKVGERYRKDVKKILDQVSATKAMGKPPVAGAPPFLKEQLESK
jgi:hypothetical protein